MRPSADALEDAVKKLEERLGGGAEGTPMEVDG